MADLDTLANLADVVAGAVVVGGVAFALVQLREFRTQRRQAASIEFVQAINTSEFHRALRVIWALPDELDADALRARGPAVVEAAVTVAWTCETFGVLVHDRTLDLGTVERILGGALRDAWRKLRPWVEDERRALASPNFAEWFQWLAERLGEHGDPKKTEGAYRTFRTWRP